MGGVVSARAQSGPPVSVQQSPPTTDLLSGLLQSLLPPPTTAPPPPAAVSAPVEPVPDPGPSRPATSSPDTPAKSDPYAIPPDAIPLINGVVRTGSNNSNQLLAALAPLTDRGMTLEEAALLGFGQFPVAGEAWWSDDFYEPRFTPEFHLHQGNDIFAARGAAIRAPESGSLEYMTGGACGLGFYVRGSDGNTYMGCHLDGFASDLSSGSYVKRGQVIGFNGDSGNAMGGAPHLHFEIHPGGGGAVNPKSTLDRWIAEAISNVPNLLGQYETTLPRPLSTAGMLRRLDIGSLGAPTTADGPKLWQSSLRRDGSGVRLTAAGATGGDGTAATAILARDAEAAAIDRVRAEQLAQEVLAPLTPKVLTGILAGPGG